MFPFQGRSPIVNIMFNTCTLISRKQIKDFVELENLQVTKKDTSDFFNKSQNFSKTMFKDELMKARPDWGLTINEQEIIIKNSSPIWKVKSLDGEINFRNGIPHFANSIFVEISKNHQVGCIYDPIRKEFFVSEFGNGSFMNDHRIRVSGKNNNYNKFKIYKETFLMMNILEGTFEVAFTFYGFFDESSSRFWFLLSRLDSSFELSWCSSSFFFHGCCTGFAQVCTGLHCRDAENRRFSRKIVVFHVKSSFSDARMPEIVVWMLRIFVFHVQSLFSDVRLRAEICELRL